MTTAADVMQALADALLPTAGGFPTSAEDRISRPGSLPTQSDQYPRLKLRFYNEVKQSLGRNAVGFTTQVTIRIDGEVSEPADLLNDVNRSAVEDQLTALKGELERAIINNYPLFGIVQQLLSVVTQWKFVAQDTQLGGIQSDYTFEILETVEDFHANAVTPLTGLDVSDPNHPRVGLSVTFPQE